MSTLEDKCLTKIINQQIPIECLEKLIQKAVVYVIINKRKINYGSSSRDYDFESTGDVYSTEDRENSRIKEYEKENYYRELEDWKEYEIMKYYLNPLFPITKVYIADTDGLPLVTNDKEYFMEMYEFY